MEIGKLALFLLAFAGLRHCLITPDEERKLKQDLMLFKAKVTSERYLETELLICLDVIKTGIHLEQHLRQNLDLILSVVIDSFNIYFDVIDPKNSEFMNETIGLINANIGKEIESFYNVAQTAKIKLDILTANLRNNTLVFESKKDKAIAGLEKCYHLHRTEDQQRSIFNCVNTYKEFLQSFEEDLDKTYRESPCMGIFHGNVLIPIEDIATRIRESTERILHSIHCSGHSDRPCLPNLPHVPHFHSYVSEQVIAAQALSINFEEIALKDLAEYLLHEYTIREQYDLKPKSVEYFKLLLNRVTEPNRSLLNKVIEEYQGNDNCHCQNGVLEEISQHIERGAKNLTACYDDLVHKTNEAMIYIKRDFLKIASDLKHGGNLAILNCITIINVYGANLVFDCYEVISKYHKMDSTKTLENIEVVRTKLDSYLEYFKENGKTLSCVTEEEEYAKLFTESAVFSYKKCFYEECQGYQHESRPQRGIPPTADPCND